MGWRLGSAGPWPPGSPIPASWSRARIKSDGGAYDIEEIALEGTALTLTATGRIDLAGQTPQIKLAVKGGVLDIDRYLPPAAPAVAPAPTAATPARVATGPLVELPSDPLDVTFLRSLDADVKVNLGGLRVRGNEFGKLDFSLVARNGAIAAELSDLALYGGTARGKLRLDAAGTNPQAQGEFMLDRLTVERLPGAASAAKGPVSASLTFATNGASPRLMAENLTGAALIDLSKAALTDVPVSAVTVKATLKGKAERPEVIAGFTYNARKVVAKLTLDALPRLLAGERFAMTLALDAEPLHASFDGRVALLPAPALDGKLALDVPSPVMLATWLGQPAASIRPDAGAIKVAATLASTGAKTTLSEATLDGKALKARLTGSLDLAGTVPVVEAKLNLDQADLDAYLAETPPAGAAPAAAPRGAAPAPATGWSTEPIDTAALKRVQARFDATLGKLIYRKLAMEGGQATITLSGGKFDGRLAALKAAGGTVEAATAFDGSLAKPKLDLSATVTGVEGRPFLIAFAGTDRVSGKADFNLKASATGGTEKELVETLAGAGAMKFTDGAVHGINLAATLRQVGMLGFDKGAGEAQKTDFAEMGGTFTIDKGVISNRDFHLLAPLVRITGAGTVPLPPRTIDYAVEAKLVASTQGQAGQDTLAGLPIPVKVTGPWDKVAVNIDYASVLPTVDPTKLKDLPNQAIDAIRGLGIIPGGRTPAPTTAPTQQQPAPMQQPAPAPDPLAPLRNLFGR
ncbi:MAG: AsmA family protein [Alphaproteobacteria bacterium]|nr:AsmA family protein [Alphaproteobacteria bacterium]